MKKLIKEIGFNIFIELIYGLGLIILLGIKMYEIIKFIGKGCVNILSGIIQCILNTIVFVLGVIFVLAAKILDKLIKKD